jgi:hypothetical protein
MKIKDGSFIHFLMNFPEYFNYPEAILGKKLSFIEKLKICYKSLVIVFTEPPLEKNFDNQVKLALINFRIKNQSK